MSAQQSFLWRDSTVDVGSFSEIEEEFMNRVRRIVWCSVTTVDRKGRPRSRILHPLWEGSTGWIGTWRHSFKAKHLEHNPYVSLCYWDRQHQQVYADCKAEWEEDPEERRRVWELFKSTPSPVGYDPIMFWEGPDDGEFGLMKLTPWRIEIASIADLSSGIPTKVWRGK